MIQRRAWLTSTILNNTVTFLLGQLQIVDLRQNSSSNHILIQGKAVILILEFRQLSLNSLKENNKNLMIHLSANFKLKTRKAPSISWTLNMLHFP